MATSESAGQTETPAVALLPSDPSAVPVARRLVRSWLSARGLSGLVSRLELATSEVVGNAVRHGGGTIKLALYRLAGQVRIEVKDQGGGRPALRSTATSGGDLGGWGLRLVDQLVDDWGTDVSDGHTVVWLQHPTTNREPVRAVRRPT